MLVQRGTLDVGDTILVGSTIGRIRTMTDDKGHKVKKAGPSTPVEITGLSEEVSREALRKAIQKLPIKCKIVSKKDQEGGVC